MTEATWWTLLEALVWISARKWTWVRMAADPSRDPYQLIYQATLNGVVLSFEDAESDVIKRLSNGELRGLGLRNGAGDPEEIAPQQWPYLKLYLEPPKHHPYMNGPCVAPRDLLRTDGTYWTDVLLRRENVLRIWAEEPRMKWGEVAPLEEPPDTEQEPAAGITEIKAIGVQQETEPSVRVVNDDSLLAEVLAWYHESWVSECQNVGIIPTREDDLEAARRVFGHRLHRDLTRAARNVHAPKKWRTTGPKGLERKRNDHGELVRRVIEKYIESWRPE